MEWTAAIKQVQPELPRRRGGPAGCTRESSWARTTSGIKGLERRALPALSRQKDVLYEEHRVQSGHNEKANGNF